MLGRSGRFASEWLCCARMSHPVQEMGNVSPGGDEDSLEGLSHPLLSPLQQ